MQVKTLLARGRYLNRLRLGEEEAIIEINNLQDLSTLNSLLIPKEKVLLKLTRKWEEWWDSAGEKEKLLFLRGLSGWEMSWDMPVRIRSKIVSFGLECLKGGRLEWEQLPSLITHAFKRR